VRASVYLSSQLGSPRLLRPDFGLLCACSSKHAAWTFAKTGLDDVCMEHGVSVSVLSQSPVIRCRVDAHGVSVRKLSDPSHLLSCPMVLAM
jgi:hypothetical protein